MNLQTPRLILKPLAEAQSQSWFQLSQDSGLTSFQISNYKMSSQNESLEWIRQKQMYLKRNGIGTVGVFLKSGDELIGLCALKYLDGERESDIEIMFRLAKEHWGKGYATEIGRALIEFAKSELFLHKLAATVDPENVASKAVLTKLGFKFSNMTDILGHNEELHYLDI